MLHALDARMRDASRDGLLVGMACNFAFVTQVFFAPAMTHVTPFMLSFTDMSYVFGALCAAFLLVCSRGSLPRMSMPLLWGLSLAMAVLFALYGLLITDVNDIASVNFATNVMFLVGGALFGVYLAYVIPLWLRVCAAHDPEEIVWTILLAGALGSVLVWFLGGMGPAPRLLVASDSMLLLGTYMLGRAVAAAQESVFSRSGESDGEQKLPVRLFAACFLMAFAFAIAISSAESRGASSSYATGTFFAPVLIACVCLLVLRGLTVSSLLNMAVPIITAVVMSASFFGVEPVLSFDLAVAGMFLFLVHAVMTVLFSLYGSSSASYRAFLAIAASFAGGCVVGRIGSAFAVAWGSVSSNTVMFLSILAVMGAFLLCVRAGSSSVHESDVDLCVAPLARPSDELLVQRRIDAAADRCGLGRREKETLELLLAGKTAAEIAEAMVVAPGTAKSHVCHVYRKLGVHSRAELFDEFGLNS